MSIKRSEEHAENRSVERQRSLGIRRSHYEFILFVSRVVLLKTTATLVGSGSRGKTPFYTFKNVI